MRKTFTSGSVGRALGNRCLYPDPAPPFEKPVTSAGERRAAYQREDAGRTRRVKGKSAMAIARQCGGRDCNFSGEHFWARGYAVSTVGFELEQGKAYIRDQDGSDDQGRF